jgi:2-amino-4,5-dihydroxy-6-oxo-7-(phosphonooxy)heptanoate synthase
MDHSVTDGPISGGKGPSLNGLVGQLAGGGVDAVVLHKGSVRTVDPAHFKETSLIVHISASTAHAPDPNAKYLVASVEECLRLGADAVSVHVNLGCAEERQQIADMAAVADACDRWNMPLLAMVYPRGPEIADPRDPGLVAHAVTLAADLGADIVKTVYTGSPTTMADVTAACPIPVVVAGGPRAGSRESVLNYVREALYSGGAGVAIGRNVFEDSDPGVMAALLSDLIHDPCLIQLETAV